MAPTFDFDRRIDRRPTASNKWRKFDKDVLPLWVTDMDFASLVYMRFTVLFQAQKD